MTLFELLPWGPHKEDYEPSLTIPANDTYLTDGNSLFRVAGTLLDINHNTLLELEDCLTLDLILFSARDAAGLGLRSIAFPCKSS